MVVEEHCLATCDGQAAPTHTPLRRSRRTSYVLQDAEFATKAARRDYERQYIHLANSPSIWWVACAGVA